MRLVSTELCHRGAVLDYIRSGRSARSGAGGFAPIYIGNGAEMPPRKQT